MLNRWSLVTKVFRNHHHQRSNQTQKTKEFGAIRTRIRPRGTIVTLAFCAKKVRIGDRNTSISSRVIIDHRTLHLVRGMSWLRFSSNRTWTSRSFYPKKDPCQIWKKILINKRRSWWGLAVTRACHFCTKLVTPLISKVIQNCRIIRSNLHKIRDYHILPAAIRRTCDSKLCYHKSICCETYHKWKRMT